MKERGKRKERGKGRRQERDVGNKIREGKGDDRRGKWEIR